MGLVIESAAYFQLCDCGEHGRIVTASGFLGLEVCSRDEALLSLARCLKVGIVASDEMFEVGEQIGSSSLPAWQEEGGKIGRGSMRYAAALHLCNWPGVHISSPPCLAGSILNS